MYKWHSESSVELEYLITKTRPLHRYRVKWKYLSEGDLVVKSTINCRNSSYQLLFCTRETKLKVFHCKFLYRRIATIDFLCKIGIKHVDSCCFYADTSEILVDLFWNCKHTQAFCKKLVEIPTFFFYTNCSLFLDITDVPVPKLQVQLLLTAMKIEKNLALDNNILNSFKRKWNPWKSILQY